MNAVRLIALLSACAVSLGVGQSDLADDTNPTLPPTGTAAHDGPTAEELKNSKTRGIFFKVPGNANNFEVEKAAPAAAGTKTPTKHNGAHKGAVHHPKTAHKAPATPGT